MTRPMDADEVFRHVYPQLARQRPEREVEEKVEVCVPRRVDPEPWAIDTRWTDQRWLAEQLRNMERVDIQEKEERSAPTRNKVQDVVETPPTKASLSAQQKYMNKLSSAQYLRRDRKRAAAALAARKYLIKLPATQRAIRRLGEAAATKQITESYVRSLRGELMSAEMMHQFLRTHFNLTLTPEELGSAMKWFDANGDGLVDVTEFLREFCIFGTVEHLRCKEIKRRKAARVHDRKVNEEAKNRFAGGPSADSFKPFQYYTTEHLESAQNALRPAAAAFQAHSHDGMRIRDIFFSGPMSASVFAATIKRVFNLRLEPHEILALAGAHPSASKTAVDTKAFYAFFTKLGRDERQRRNHQRLKSNKHRLHKERRFQHHAKLRFAPEYKARVVWPSPPVSSSS